MGRNDVGEEGLACRATSAPPMGMVKGYRQQQRGPCLGMGVWDAGKEGEAMASALQTSQ